MAKKSTAKKATRSKKDYELRSKVIKLLARGLSQTEIAKLLGKTPQRIHQIVKEIREGDEDGLHPWDVKVKFQAIEKELWKNYDKAKDVKEKVMVLAEIRETNARAVQIMQSMGLLPRVPDEINMVATQQIQVDSKIAEIPKEEREKIAKVIDTLQALREKRKREEMNETMYGKPPSQAFN